MAFARELLPVLGYKKRIEVMTPLIPSLLGPNKKMSSSEPETLIKVNDSPESIKTKLLSAYCPEGVVDGNPIMALYRYLIFPNYGKIKIEREPRFGGDIEFNSYEEMERQYLERKLHPLDIKNALAKYIIDLFKDVRSYWEQHRDLLEKLGPQFL
jgi:tyrosyl-tRNA synthetase